MSSIAELRKKLQASASKADAKRPAHYSDVHNLTVSAYRQEDEKWRVARIWKTIGIATVMLAEEYGIAIFEADSEITQAYYRLHDHKGILRAYVRDEEAGRLSWIIEKAWRELGEDLVVDIEPGESAVLDETYLHEHDYEGAYPGTFMVRSDADDFDARDWSEDSGVGLRHVVGNCFYLATKEDAALFAMRFGKSE